MGEGGRRDYNRERKETDESGMKVPMLLSIGCELADLPRIVGVGLRLLAVGLDPRAVVRRCLVSRLLTAGGS